MVVLSFRLNRRKTEYMERKFRQTNSNVEVKNGERISLTFYVFWALII